MEQVEGADAGDLQQDIVVVGKRGSRLNIEHYSGRCQQGVLAAAPSQAAESSSTVH